MNYHAISNPGFWKCVILWMFVIAWMFNILSFSSQPAELSKQRSGYIVEFIQKTMEKLGGESFLKSVDKNQMDHYVRKAAHIFNYLVLTLLLLFALRNTPLISMIITKSNQVFFFSWGIAMVFSVFDEFYQTFIPGRSGLVSDVIIDHIGILLGILVVYIMYKRISKQRQKCEKAEG